MVKTLKTDEATLVRRIEELQRALKFDMDLTEHGELRRQMLLAEHRQLVLRLLMSRPQYYDGQKKERVHKQGTRDGSPHNGGTDPSVQSGSSSSRSLPEPDPEPA